jgi:hypothetical protein
MLAGPNLSATFGSSESMGTNTDEPQAVPEKKMRSADDAFSVETRMKPMRSPRGLTREGGSHILNDRRKRESTREQGHVRRTLSVREHGRPVLVADKT